MQPFLQQGTKTQAETLLQLFDQGEYSSAQQQWNSTSNEQKKAILQNGNYSLFAALCGKGNLAAVQLLWASAIAPDVLSTFQVKKMLRTNGLFLPFRLLCQNGHLDVIEWLWGAVGSIDNLSFNFQQGMLKGKYYGGFKQACMFGHQHIAQWIWDKIDPRFRLHMLHSRKVYISGVDYENALELAWPEHKNIARWLLLLDPSMFASAVDNYYIYREIVDSIISDKQLDLETRQAELLRHDPSAVFDVEDENEAEYLIRMAGHFISKSAIHPEGYRNSEYTDIPEMEVEEAAVQVQSFTQLPTVRRLLTQSVRLNRQLEANYLFNLANECFNQPAAACLLDIPEVHELACANDYYLRETTYFDYFALTQVTASSMDSFQQEKKFALEKLTAHYKPIIESQEDPHQVFNEFLARLAQEYRRNPVQFIKADHTTIELPLALSDFDTIAIQMSDEERKAALREYYKHDAHTILRYFSKSNSWSKFGVHYGRPALTSIDESIDLISLLYIAAIDNAPSAMPEDKTVSLEFRYQYFLKELALICKANNWDKVRAAVPDDLSTDEEHAGREVDTPHHNSKLHQRLLQALQFHPLQLKKLTQEIIRAKKRIFIRNLMEKKFESESQTSLESALRHYKKAACNFDQYSIQVLDRYNITDEEVNEFINLMSSDNKYKSNWSTSHSECLKKEFEPRKYTNHFMDYASVLDLPRLLENVLNTKKSESRSVVTPMQHWLATSTEQFPLTNTNASASNPPPSTRTQTRSRNRM